MKIKLPATVKMVLDSLQAKGYEAYAVGGCVRDSILGRMPQDWDITTSATPEQVKQIFPRTIDTGIQHGTVTVLIGGSQHEVTTYRVDGKYSDGRHPESVTFTASLEEDLRRRDFTINAMAYNEQTGLVDLYGGMVDLQRKRIRCVGDAEQRFSEDALRIMRAVRFSAQLHFSIEQKTIDGIRLLAPTLRKISAERVCMELTKLITSDHPEYLQTAYETGITAVVFPEFDRMMETPQNNPHHRYSVGEHTLAAMQACDAERVLRFTMLLHDVGKPECRTTDESGVDHFYRHAQIGADLAGKIMRRLKMDNDTIHLVKLLIMYHDARIEPTEKSVRRLLNKVGKENFPLLMQVQTADTKAQSKWRQEEKLQRIAMVTETAQRILEEGQCVSLSELAVNGKDLINAGVPKGPQIGQLLQLALDRVLENPAANSKEILLQYIREAIGPKNASE